MSVEGLQVIARNFYISAGIFSGIVVILFFRFQIWRIIGDLSGANAKREIRAISKQERAMDHHSQGLLAIKPLREGTEFFVCTDDTECWDEKQPREIIV